MPIPAVLSVPVEVTIGVMIQPYRSFIIVVTLLLMAVRWLITSKAGLILQSIRDDEKAPPRLRLSDSIVTHIERLIVGGTLKPGDDLPAERELAQQFNVSRPSLREAIRKLETKGLLQPRRSGGMQVVDAYTPTLTDPLVNLLSDYPEARFDILELRHALERAAASHAARRATAEDRERLKACIKELRRVAAEDDPMNFCECDAAFHLALADASHNVALSYVMRGLFNLLRSSIGASLERLWDRLDARKQLVEQHEAIWAAIRARDPEKAAQAAHEHLSYVETVLRDTR